jgi:regulator of nonsense transcripts 3
MDYVAGRRRRDGGETTTTTTSLSRFYAVVRDGRTVQRMIDAYYGTTFRVRARDGDGNAIGEDEEAAETTTASVERAPSEWTPETYGATFGTLGTPESAGTIEDDEEYVSFVEALEREREEGRTTAPATPRMESTTTTRKSTALLEYIWKKRAQEQRATTGGGKKKSSGKKKSKSSKSKREGKSTTRLDDEPVAADAAPKRKQKPKAKSKKKSTSSTPTTTTPTTTTTTTKVLKRPSSIPTPRA